MWTNDTRYFNRDCEGTVFGKPCLVLDSVCWMNPWARLECVPVPRPDSEIDIYIYHMYCDNFRMNNNLIISAGDQSSKELETVKTIKWPLKESDK